MVNINTHTMKHRSPYKLARRLVDLSQQEAAKRTKLSQSVISSLESGGHDAPGWETIGRLATLYGCSPFELQPLKFKPRPAVKRFVLGAGPKP